LRGFFLHDYRQPYVYIASSPSFNHLQSAYRKHHSTETSLIYLLDSVYHEADNGLVTLLLLNLSAGFDTIDHSILLNRLTSSFGIMDFTHNWLKSYRLPSTSPNATSPNVKSLNVSSPNFVISLLTIVGG